MNKLVFKDLIDQTEIYFWSDATQSAVDALPEVEWYAAKHVLINFGYKIIEINEN